ncbi:MAG TPA: class I SAM-dependent methyltransferase [Bryobacteraceae bacterium]|nr:class I SAM-dependent methyltransferase [Bryobacteraceae bacterium]
MHASIYTIADQERMAHATNYFAWQGRLVVPELGHRVIEVGCGIGNFTGLLLDREIVLAVDVDPACIGRLQQRYSNRPNLHAFLCEPSSEAFAALARFHPDSCVCLNVLEHIEDDHRALEAFASVLVPGGAIVLLVPAFEALYGPIDRNLSHHRRYSRGALAELAHGAGLRIEKLHYVNALGFFGWWTNAHILRREAQSARQIRTFDRCVVPWLARLEAIATPPFGQSLFALLRKP